MDIICAKCDMRLNGIEACREHKCPSPAKPSFKVARNTNLTDNDWIELEKHFNISKPKQQPNKPLARDLEIGFPELVLANIPSDGTVKEPLSVFSWVLLMMPQSKSKG